jgi:hypothetical protein
MYIPTVLKLHSVWNTDSIKVKTAGFFFWGGGDNVRLYLCFHPATFLLCTVHTKTQHSQILNKVKYYFTFLGRKFFEGGEIHKVGPHTFQWLVHFCESYKVR